MTAKVILALIGLVGLLYALAALDAPSNSTGTASGLPAMTRYDLELLSSRGGPSDSSSYMKVTGQVRNSSGRDLRNVAVVVSWLSASGQFITSDTALIEYNPILAGQTSPFDTITRRNPEMSQYRIEFKTLGGGTLSVQDSRGNQR